MDTLERFHIYKITRENIQINDKNTSKPNIIFRKKPIESPLPQLTALHPFTTHASLRSQVTLYACTLRPAILFVSKTILVTLFLLSHLKSTIILYQTVFHYFRTGLHITNYEHGNTTSVKVHSKAPTVQT